MARRSPRKKVISPVTVANSDEEEFAAVASDDQIDLCTSDDESAESPQDRNRGKKKVDLVPKRKKHNVAVRKNQAADDELEDDEVMDITPPSTPSPVKAIGGKKRVIADHESDDDSVFIPSPTRDSPKKARAKEPSTPSKISKTARQLVFDTAVSVASSELKGDKGKLSASASKSPSKAVPPAIELNESTVYLADVEMRRVVVPELNRCQIYEPSLVDHLLKRTYRDIPRLPRMADYAPAWGPRSSDGGFQFSQALPYYKSPDVEYLKRLLAFSHDRAGNIANLSRIDPTLLGVKDANSFTKNALYLHGSDPKEWVIKDVAGVLPTLELERFIAVLGLAYKLPYVPDDNTRREQDLLHLTMLDNAFCFATVMMPKSDFDNAKAGSSSRSTPKGMKKHNIFAPASPAFSSRASVSSSAARKPSLRASETVPIYDGRKRQLKVPEELSKIPDILPRYIGNIPEYSLALVAYTVSTYLAASGARKDQVTANLHIHLAVVLHEQSMESVNELSEDEEKDEVNE